MSTIKKSLPISLYVFCAVLTMPSLAMEDEEDFFSSSPISVKRNVIGSEGAKALTSLTNLTRLDLYNNHIGAAGAAPLASLPRLIGLDLSWNDIRKDENAPRPR